MGNGISDNYENINPLFITGMWNVHSANSKLTGEKVSLWVLDQDKLKKTVSKKADREAYLKACMDSIQQMRRLMHPHVLKIYEFTENLSQLGFAAEPVQYSFVYEANFTLDETQYIALQLAETLDFLHTSAKLAYLNISQSSLVLTQSLDVKLCEFNFASPIINEQNLVGSRIGAYSHLPTQPDIAFSSPELVSNKQITTVSDVFSYGALILSMLLKRIAFSPGNSQDLIAQAQTAPMQVPPNVSPEFRDLLIACLDIDPTKRPEFSQIVKSNAFLSMDLRIYKYLDMIITKEPSDKFQFYKNLPNALQMFSPRVLRYKFAPLFIKEVQDEIKYGPILIPLTIKVGAQLESLDFYNEIIMPLGPSLTCTNPPEVLSSVFGVMEDIFAKLTNERTYDVCYPIYMAALQSGNKKLILLGIDKMPLLIAHLNPQTIQSSLMPKLGDFIVAATDITSVVACIQCLTFAVDKVDQDWFAQQIMPKLIEAVNKRPTNPEIVEPMAEILEKLRATIDSGLRQVIPLASVLLANPQVDAAIQMRLCNAITNVVEKVKRDRKLAEGGSKKPARWGTGGQQQQQAQPEVSAREMLQKAQPQKSQIEDDNSADIFGQKATNKAPTKFSQGRPTAAALLAQASQQQHQQMQQQSPPPQQRPVPQVPAQQQSMLGDDGNDAPAEAAPAPQPAKKPSSMFSGLSVSSNQQQGHKPNAWKRPNK